MVSSSVLASSASPVGVRRYLQLLHPCCYSSINADVQVVFWSLACTSGHPSQPTSHEKIDGRCKC